MKRLRASLSYSNVVSTLCLFLVLGGGAAWAATQLPKNSVGPKQLKQGAVTAAKLKQGAVTPAKLSQSAKSTLTGPAGPIGPVGPQGPKGDAGAPATALWAQISSSGEVVKGKGVVGASQPGEPGIYQVDFDRNVVGCAYVASGADYPAGIFLVEPRDQAPNAVYVEATESYSGPPIASRFNLAVFC